MPVRPRLRRALRGLRLRHLAIGLPALALVVAIAGAGIRLYSTARRVNSHTSLLDVIGAVENQNDQPGTLAYRIHHNQRVNILLLGYGGPDHDGPYLTDSIMVVSLQGTSRVALTSVPRDTYVTINAFANGGEYDGKINAAYEIPLSQGSFGPVEPQYVTADPYQGAGALASDVVGGYLGIHIDYWVGLDFAAFKQMVDAVHGVDVVNPYSIDDDAYPVGESDATEHIHFDAGPLHLDGNQALIYVRTRHQDSDFGRSRRQQQVLQAVRDKALRLETLPQLFNLMNALGDNVRTNLSLNDMKVLWDIGGAIDAPSAHHVSIDDTTLQYDASDPYAGYILLPRDSTLTNIQHYIGSELVDPAALREAATVQVVDSADEDSLGDSFAGIWTRLLSMIGFTMAQPDSLRTAPPTTQVLDFSGGRAAATARWLAAYFGGSVVTESPEEAPQALPAGSPTPSLSPSPVQAQIVVQIGQDFAGAFDHEQRPAGSAPPADYNAPNPSPTLFPEGSPSPSPEVSPSLSPSPTPQPSASASASGSPHTEPSPSASPAPSGTPVATPSPRPSPSPPRPTPT